MNNRPSQAHVSFIEDAISKRSGKGSLHNFTNRHAKSQSCEDDSNMENAQHETCDDTTTVKNLSTEQGYEYLDHTADVQLHAWGTSLSQCLAQLIRCMFGYMTNIDLVDVDEETSQHVGENVIAQGHDWYSLIFAFMDEWLFVFHDTGLLVTELEIVSINRETFSISSKGKGEKIDLRKHTQGTEIKAITYSNMEMQEHENRCDIWVIVDI